MPYATTTDLIHAAGGEERYVQLFDWNEDGVADVAVIERAQLFADGRIDGYARRRYATPIANPSATIRAFAARLIVHDTRKIRGVISSDEVMTSEKEHAQFLDDLAAGKVSPSDPEPSRPLGSTVSIFEDMSDTNLAAWRLVT